MAVSARVRVARLPVCPPARQVSGMRSHTYSRFVPGDGDAVDLESLLEQLADFLLQSGFAGGPTSHPWWGDVGEEADRSLEALKQAILEALIDSGQFTPEMLAAMRGEGDAESE